MDRDRKMKSFGARIGPLVCFVAAISLIGSIAAAFASDFADTAGATPALRNLVVHGSAALVALAGVALHGKFIRTERP
jgi:hypothetical protein